VTLLLRGVKGDDLRGNDENQHGPLKDLLHIPFEPITRVRFKKIKEAFNGLI
jgi:hypothetical protein